MKVSHSSWDLPSPLSTHHPCGHHQHCCTLRLGTTPLLNSRGHLAHALGYVSHWERTLFFFTSQSASAPWTLMHMYPGTDKWKRGKVMVPCLQELARYPQGHGYLWQRPRKHPAINRRRVINSWTSRGSPGPSQAPPSQFVKSCHLYEDRRSLPQPCEVGVTQPTLQIDLGVIPNSINGRSAIFQRGTEWAVQFHLSWILLRKAKILLDGENSTTENMPSLAAVITTSKLMFVHANRHVFIWLPIFQTEL